jgi:hypothetical protein
MVPVVGRCVKKDTQNVANWTPKGSWGGGIYLISAAVTVRHIRSRS